jgi:hypothetical protein
MRISFRMRARGCRGSSRSARWSLAAVALLGVIAVVAAAAQATPTGGARPMRASQEGHSLTCRSLHVFILYYQSHVAPNAGGVSPAPNGCWTWADLRGVSQPNWKICHYNGLPNGTGASVAYDDTSPNHTSPTDSSQITGSNCLGGSSGTVNVEYESPGNCSTPNWTDVVPSGVTVIHRHLETYCGDSSRDSNALVSGFTYTSTYGAVVNVGADVPNGDGGPCTIGATNCMNNLTNDVETACNNTPNSDWISLYSNYPTPADVVGWVNAALNTCS